MASNATLGDARRDVMLAFIRDFIEENGYSPTVRQIAVGAGLASPGAAHRHIERLIEEGKLERVRVTAGNSVYVPVRGADS